MSGQTAKLAQKMLSIGVTLCKPLIWFASSIGGFFLGRFMGIAGIFAILWATAFLAVRRSSWTLPVRRGFSRQVLFTAVDSIPASLRFAAVFGVLLIVQAAIWLDMVGGTPEVIAPVLWQVIVRELSPLLACLVVIGRSGIAIGTELASMRAGGEIEILDSQGVDPMTYLVMPRILAVVLSVFCLSIIIALTMIVTGYSVGRLMDVITMPWSDFFGEVSRRINLEDGVFFLSKTIVAGAFAGAICCITGLSIRGAVTDVPFVTSRVGIQALTSVFVISAILSIVFYGKLLVFKIG